MFSNKFSLFSYITLPALLISFSALGGYDEVCEVPRQSSPIAFWDFNKDNDFSLTDGKVRLGSRHGGVRNIPGTDLRGLRFRFEGKWPDGDSSSELRYKFLEPQSHVWEYMRIYQPPNFYHRLIIEIETSSPLNVANWNFNDRVVSDNGHYAKVAKAFKNKLFIEAPDSIYDKAWGKGRTITNVSTGNSFDSNESKYIGANNKLSAMWQGEYSNAAMIVGTTSVAANSGGQPGNGYCEALGSKSTAHATFGTKGNMARMQGPPLCFDMTDNGTIVEFAIERKRSSSLKNPDGIYTIWKRTNSSDWTIVYHNNKIPAYQDTNNYFDKGYIFGWSNSGFKEDTDFYLLSWGLWTERPNFL
ncbi:hypothetical protein [Salinimonas sediminis]|uniref:Uncharacterized protein n=1 Tax=Salinimonas sediminis TaxID=2303538 RepID=A0A346NP74_9ALTE|nr:hypothetical protein [Salinimonas sediminis]AXR07331.1 hypothetical protein D0Y50_13835 [Salinimonas sediminis]